MTDLTVVHSNIYVYCFVVVAVADVVLYVFFYYYLVFYFLFFLDISDTDFWSTSQPVSREVALLIDSLIFTVLAYRASGCASLHQGFQQMEELFCRRCPSYLFSNKSPHSGNCQRASGLFCVVSLQALKRTPRGKACQEHRWRKLIGTIFYTCVIQ